jgi:glycerol-3-phosphate acyltransferase PlsY
MITLSLLIFALAYLLGSISSAILLCRLFGLADPRSIGSGNPGATNVLRIGGKFPALLVLLFDLLKGLLPVYIGYYLGLAPLNLALVAIGACLGHMFPMFFRFSGGKAVATGFGAILPLGIDLAILLLCTWLLVLWLTKYSSLAAILSLLLAPLYTWLLHPEYALAVSLLSLLIIIRHKANIQRLCMAQETKIGANKDLDSS